MCNKSINRFINLLHVCVFKEPNLITTVPPTGAIIPPCVCNQTINQSINHVINIHVYSRNITCSPPCRRQGPSYLRMWSTNHSPNQSINQSINQFNDFNQYVFKEASLFSTMPAAGAIIPPCVIPLREPIPGVPSNRIDTETYIELETGIES